MKYCPRNSIVDAFRVRHDPMPDWFKYHTCVFWTKVDGVYSIKQRGTDDYWDVFPGDWVTMNQDLILSKYENEDFLVRFQIYPEK